MHKSAIGAAACLAALLCSCTVLGDTTDTTLMGYKFASDIQGYLNISQDVCDIKTAVDAGDLATAESIYASGKNSVRSTGEKRALKGWATSGGADEPHWGLYTAFFGNDSDWLDTFIDAAFDGESELNTTAARAQLIKKGIQSNLLVSYMFHEVDEAAELVEDGKTDAKTGAPHIVDEAAAIYFASTPTCATGSLADVALSRARSFGTLVTAPGGTCTAATTVAVAAALMAMQQAALKADEAAYAAAAKALEKQIVIIFAQATLTYSKKISDLVAAGNATDGAQAEAVAFFRSIAPLVAEVSEDDAAAIGDALAVPANTTDAEVREGFQAVLAQYNVTAVELGTLGATSPCNATSGTATTTTSPTAPVTSTNAAAGAAGATMAAAGAVLGALALLL